MENYSLVISGQKDLKSALKESCEGTTVILTNNIFVRKITHSCLRD